MPAPEPRAAAYIPRSADRRVERLARRRRAHREAGAQEQAENDNEHAVRTDGLFRDLRRFDHREPLALAFRFEIFGDLRFGLLGENLLVFELCRFEFPRLGMILALDLGDLAMRRS